MDMQPQLALRLLLKLAAQQLLIILRNIQIQIRLSLYTFQQKCRLADTPTTDHRRHHGLRGRLFPILTKRIKLFFTVIEFHNYPFKSILK